MSVLGLQRAYKDWVTPAMEDMALLQQYVRQGSDAAFEALLNRHVNLVYSTALRRVGDPGLAGEVTQTAFIILSRKAGRLSSNTLLSGWLYRTTQYAATRALRTEMRRRERERRAAEMSTDSSNSIWDLLAPILEECLDELGAPDRNALVLRYFENKAAKDVAVALGVNEAAAQKRLTRAVEKLRKLCTRRGVVLPAVVLTTVISANAVQAAPAATVAATSVAVKGGVSLSTAAIVKGTLHLLAWAKCKSILLACLSIAIVAASAVALTKLEAGGTGSELEVVVQYAAQLDNGQRESPRILSWQTWRVALDASQLQRDAARGLQSLGTNAVPTLLSLLERKDTGVGAFFRNDKTPAWIWHWRAALAFEALGEVGRPAVPELSRLIHETNATKAVAIALAAVGPDGWDVLNKNVNDPLDVTSGSCIWAIGSHQINTPDTIPSLTNCILQGSAMGMDAVAIWALSELSDDPGLLIPICLRGMQSPRIDMRWCSALALGHLGSKARSYIPQLAVLLKDGDPLVRHDAAQALEEIDPKVAKSAGVAGALAEPHHPKTWFD